MPEEGAHASAGAAERGRGEGAASPETARPRAQRLYYGLGLTLQTFLWFLLFLAILVAVLVGGHLTEFRYVGF